MPANLVTKIVETMVITPTGRNPDARIRRLKAAIKRVEGEVEEDFFFPFEISENAEEEILRLKGELNRFQMAQAGYPELDYTFLTWRKKDTKLPAFMVIDLESREFSISVDPWGRSGDKKGHIDLESSNKSFDPELPEELAEQYMGSVEYLAHLSAKSYGWDEIKITAEFAGGVMPNDLRSRVRKVQERELFDQIFVIAEAPAWKVEQIARAKGDPLVVGWSDETAQMFLIGVFDPTPLEKYVEEQFIK